MSLRIALFAVAACCASGAALAEPPTGSRLGSHTQPGPAIAERDHAIGARDLASCMFNRKRSLALQMLLATTKAEEEAASQTLMGEVTCFNAVFANDLVEERHVSYPPDILRGMMAEAALSHRRTDAEQLKPLPLQQAYQRDWYVITGRHLSVDEMGACIADTNPGGILALIRTEPLGKQESAAFGALTGNLGKCLRAGTKLQASRQALRAALADALFQRLSRPQPAPPTVTSAEAAKP
jgi:hypothetical protein